MAQISSNTFIVQIVAPPAPQSISFQLNSPTGGADLPFTLGYGFRQGDFPPGTSLTTDASDIQVVIKRRWNDNSVKHAVVSGRVTLNPGDPKTVTIVQGTGSTAAPLTSANIQAAAPVASVQCGAIGTVQLSTLLASPVRTWVSGPEMVECHYRAPVGADATLEVWFHVRLWKNGRLWVRAICENGRINTTTTDRSYVPTVVIGGVTIYNNGGTPLLHYRNTRWSVEGWIGGDPQVTPKHNAAYAISTRLVPNYWKRIPASSALDALKQSYNPMSNVDHTASMGDAGYQPPIGLLPLWDALYCTSSDPRAWRSMLANSSGFNSYGIVWRDTNTGQPPRPSDWPSYIINSGTFNVGRGTLNWEMNHAPSAGYAAYLFSGDYWHYETMMLHAALLYLCRTNGQGVNRLLTAETRGTAWNLRTLGQACAIAPSDDPLLTDYQALLSRQYTHWQNIKNTAGINQLGSLYQYSMGAWTGTGSIAPWMTDFWVATNGHLSDIEPLPAMGALNDVRDWMYRWAVGRLGGGGSGNYCFTQAAQYGINIASVNNTDATTWFDSWGQVYTATFGVPNTNCSTILQGSSGGAPSTAPFQGYWGVVLVAIAYAVDHGAAGASESWSRLNSASNWGTVEGSGFDNAPTWGVVPRGYGGT